ncbi:MAG: hypothetical protein ACKVPX_18240 [Myxococcaceae bacterium]
MRRIAAIALHELRLELVRRRTGLEKGPLALVLARPDSSVKDERSLLGNTRLDEVSSEARAWGVFPGHTVAAARAKLASLPVRVLPLEVTRDALASLAEAALAFGATTSFALDPAVVWVDITGCAHLHASPTDTAGESTLAHTLSTKIAGWGHACRVAISDGPQVALAMAYFATKNVSVVQPGKAREALAPLPIAALSLSGEQHTWLGNLGIRTVGQLQSMPQGPLALRLGASATRVLALLRGEDALPLTPYVPPEIIEERVDFEYGVETTEGLLFVVRRLVSVVEARLSARGHFATALELRLMLDRALSKGVPELKLVFQFPEPLRDAASLLAVMKIRLEATALPAPVRALCLRAPGTARRTARPQSLFAPLAKAELHLPRLSAELLAELGPERVGVFELRNTWLPRARAALVPPGQKRAVGVGQNLPSAAPEPLRRLWTAKPHVVQGTLRTLVRAEGLEWWKRTSTGPVDWAAEWLPPWGALAWVQLLPERDQAWFLGWVDG